MASRSVARVTADWSKLSTQLHPTEVPKLNKLKAQVDATSTKVSTLPESLPKIDWAHYKAHAANPKLVEEIEKKYASIQIAPPKASESRLNELKKSLEQDKARFERFVKIAESYVESAEVVKTKFNNMIPIPEMNMEDWVLTFPNWSSTIENPSIWPHFGRVPGLTREEAAAWDQPDPLPYATKTAWKEWEEKKKKYYS